MTPLSCALAIVAVATVRLTSAANLVGGQPGTIPPLFPPYLGGNSPWFPGPNVNGIPYETPQGCSIDMAGFTSRHGSRYPDPSSYQQWTALHSKIQNSSFSATGPLSFIKGWQPVLAHPDLEMSQVSLGGYKELYDMGVSYRWRYPKFYTDNQPFILWSNEYAAAPRVIDSARLFARGYIGPNATTAGSVYVLNSTDPRSVANSLGASDLCNTYSDDSGGSNARAWANVYLPPIAKRLNALISPPGSLNLTTDDVVLFPYLCGFETQITGTTSPWCELFNESELQQYEYAQDIRYYYGSGPGAVKNGTLMLPFISALVQRFVDGPSKTYTNSDNTTFTPPPLIATFTNDGQINQMVSEIGVFDDQVPLPATHIPAGQKYVASNYVTMRGTIGFERLNCRGNLYVRILLNDAVYPVVNCTSGPGSSCPLQQYAQIIAQKQAAAGDFVTTCKINGTAPGTAKTTFLTDLALPFEYVVKP